MQYWWLGHYEEGDKIIADLDVVNKEYANITTSLACVLNDI